MKDFLREFEIMAESGQSIELINNYRGISVVNPANVKQVREGYVSVGVHPHQAVCMSFETHTLVRSSSFPQVLRARAVAIDVCENEAVLAEFLEAGTNVGRRNSARVQASRPLDADIYHNFQRIPCKLADISATGIGLFAIETYIHSSLDFTLGGEVVVDVLLPPSDTTLRFQGKIVSMADTGGHYLRRIGLEIFPDERSKPILESYVENRMKELQSELDRVYTAMTGE